MSTVAYDANGNTLSDSSGKTYTWDFENRLVEAVVPGTGTTTFKYDPFGRRIQKSGPLGTTNYLYDGASLIEEADGGGNVLARYTQGQGVDQPLSELRSGTISYYEPDGLGSVTSLSSSAGALANTYTYDSYGRLTASTGSLVNPLQYTAREFDSETQLYYNRARYRDPAAGRWLSEDPINFKGGGNFYRYVGNNPVNMMDPLGLCKRKDTADCILSGLEALFPGITASVGDTTNEVGGHWNFTVQLQFSSYDDAYSFYTTYDASARNGINPPARFGAGPALHLENLIWAPVGSDGTYTANATAHIDLYNPDTGVGGVAGHSGIDFIWGHIVELLGGDIDPANCPW